jgi:DNA-binding response OmpR family regulator
MPSRHSSPPTTTARILLVDDNAHGLTARKTVLEEVGHRVTTCTSGADALETFGRHKFDLVVTDYKMPRMDGLELIRRWRRAGDSRPVLILTARDALSDRVDALELGGDDFMAKPFELPELIARVRALIRRSKAVASSQLTCGALEMDLGRRTAQLDGQPLELRRREWEILECLLLSSPKMVTKETLVQILTGWGSELTNNAVEVYVSRLRAKLQSSGIEIHTIRGIGYRLDAPEP